MNPINDLDPMMVIGCTLILLVIAGTIYFHDWIMGLITNQKLIKKYNSRMDRAKYYRPLPPCVTIGPSEVEGLGLLSRAHIGKGVILGVTHIKHRAFRDGYIRTPLGGFINHSDEPNVETIKRGRILYLKSIRDIKPNEEITLKYHLYNLNENE